MAFLAAVVPNAAFKKETFSTTTLRRRGMKEDQDCHIRDNQSGDIIYNLEAAAASSTTAIVEMASPCCFFYFYEIIFGSDGS
jgi:hypothetical protein